MKAGLFIVLGLLLAPSVASANISTLSHQLCMAKMQDGPAIALHDRFRPLVESEEEWDRLVSVVLETWHEACFSLLGVEDNREKDDQMPWVSPGMICEPSGT